METGPTESRLRRWFTIAAALLSRRGVTRRGELVAELAVYDEAKRLYQQLVREGRKELESDLAELCSDKALIHQAAADGHGALGEYDQAIAIRERLVNQEGRRELANDLATVFSNKAIAVSALGDTREAVALYDLAIAVQRRLVEQDGRCDVSGDLMTNELYRAEALQGMSSLSVDDCRRAQTAFTWVRAESERTGRADMQKLLRWTQANLDGVV